MNQLGHTGESELRNTLARRVDSFKRSSEIKSCPQFEVDFLLFYAQNERDLSEFNPVKMVAGGRFKLSFKTVKSFGQWTGLYRFSGALCQRSVSCISCRSRAFYRGLKTIICLKNSPKHENRNYYHLPQIRDKAARWIPRFPS
jgi:hypothetical protein